jgi:transcriptional/translational regulatory protein YebC/TACO1
MVRCATDNRNRTAGEMRMLFSKNHGNMGESGCVNWLFKERGEVTIESSKSLDEETLLNMAVEAGADDVETQEDQIDKQSIEQIITFICVPNAVESVKEKIVESFTEYAKKFAGNKKNSMSFNVVNAQNNLVPNTVVEITDKNSAQQLLKLLDALENQDDAQQVYANFDMDASWLSELS